MASTTGYGVASVAPLDDSGRSTGAGTTERVTLTGPLGCTETGVDAYHLAPGDPVELSAGREQVVVSLGQTASPTLDETPVPPRGVGRVSPDHHCTLDSERAVTVVVVTAVASNGTEAAVATPDPTTVDLTAVEYRVPTTSEIATARLTAPLGCTDLKTNARVLEPGQAVPTHTEGRQEELFVPLHGPAGMVVADERIETPPGTVVRVPPETLRSAVNDGDSDARWVMFGAPPTGGPEEWDPGAEILD
jgi:mannose-6-phosphate isomerase-like protein (cupin superfamily)